MLWAYYPGISHRASRAVLTIDFCRPAMRLCYQRLWVNLQKSFYDANRTRHCWEIYLPRTSLSEVDTSPQKRHRWRCRLIPSVLGAPRGDFFTIPAQNLAYGMRYNAGNGGVQLSVNLISRLEEERPTRLYACREWIRTPDQALGNSRFSRLGHPGGLFSPTAIMPAYFLQNIMFITDLFKYKMYK